MTIEDPTAIPETAEACDEYVAEADVAWQAENPELAQKLYMALFSASYDGSARDLMSYRLALIFTNQGNTSEAYRFAQLSHHPGAADLLRSIDNATPDLAVDPNRVPETSEEAQSYWSQAVAALDSNDNATAAALFEVLANCEAISISARGIAHIKLGTVLHRQGHDDAARKWAEAGLPLVVSGDGAEEARTLLRTLGVQVVDDNPYETEGSLALIAGIEAYERGESAAARASLETALASTSSTSEDKGRAAYYLGAIAYYDHDFAVARTHLHQARTDAPAAERAWAAEMLEWRWQETPTT